MKKNLMLSALLLPFLASAQVNVGGTINDKANEKTGDAIDAVWNAPGKLKNKNKDKDQSSSSTTTDNSSSTTTTTTDQSTTTTTSTSTSAAPTIKTYQNYDFVAGTDLIFSDDFTTDMDGEFPAHWELDNGQGVVNKIASKSSFFLTDGNYVRVHPRVTPNSYLNGDSWTVETDVYSANGDYGLRFMFYSAESDIMDIQTSIGYVEATFPKSETGDEQSTLSANLPDGMGNEAYMNIWHHIAIAYKAGQMKVYVDQARVLVIPNCHCKPTSVTFGGIGSNENPLKFTNVRIANGGDQNMLNALNTNGKIITYGITFDVNKSDIHPESMGTLNSIAKMMKDNPALNLEVGGYTDSDGDDASNLKLSQARADEVKKQLVALGIDASRLTAKGYGEASPVAPNTTFEGKSKNRRVEFKKI